jgi:hypothetical protein
MMETRQPLVSPSGLQRALERLEPSVAALLLSGILTALVILFLVVVPRPNPYVVIEAEADMMIYKVRRPELAAVPLVAATLREPQLQREELLTALLKPSADSIVRYRWSPGEVAIEVVGASSAGELEYADERVVLLPARIRVVQRAEDCSGAAARPLPIAGPAEIGAEYGVVTTPRLGERRVYGLMHSGTLQIFGRAAMATGDNVLYPVAQFPLPSAGRLTGSADLSTHATAELAPWYGVADFCGTSLRISATTDTTELRLQRVGAAGESVTFGIGLVTVLLKDPSFTGLTLVTLAFIVIIPAVTGWLALRRARTAPGAEEVA